VTFGGFELDVAAFSLRKGDHRVRLEKLPMEVLILLVDAAGGLLERHAIIKSLWGPGIFVEHDTAINTAIRKIRRALGDNADRPRFVETVVGKGYRFIASVTPVSRADRPRPAMFPTHAVVRGTQEFALEDGDNVLGRDPAAQIRVDHPSVSRRHARIVLHEGRATLEDLASRNGTFVDGRPVEATTDIAHGAIIGLGPITLTFVARSASLTTEPMEGSRSARRASHT